MQTGAVRDPRTSEIIAAAIEVHRQLGPGLLESTYEECFCRELQLRNIPFARQVGLPLEYKGVRVDCGYRIDVIVAYLRLTGKHVGLLINFNVPVLKDGIMRRVL
jgi:hypothetical protein